MIWAVHVCALYFWRNTRCKLSNLSRHLSHAPFKQLRSDSLTVCWVQVSEHLFHSSLLSRSRPSCLKYLTPILCAIAAFSSSGASSSCWTLSTKSSSLARPHSSSSIMSALSSFWRKTLNSDVMVGFSKVACICPWGLGDGGVALLAGRSGESWTASLTKLACWVKSPSVFCISFFFWKCLAHFLLNNAPVDHWFSS